MQRARCPGVRRISSAISPSAIGRRAGSPSAQPLYWQERVALPAASILRRLLVASEDAGQAARGPGDRAGRVLDVGRAALPPGNPGRAVELDVLARGAAGAEFARSNVKTLPPWTGGARRDGVLRPFSCRLISHRNPENFVAGSVRFWATAGSPWAATSNPHSNDLTRSIVPPLRQTQPPFPDRLGPHAEAALRLGYGQPKGVRRGASRFRARTDADQDTIRPCPRVGRPSGGLVIPARAARRRRTAALLVIHPGFAKTATTSLQQGVFARHGQIHYLGVPASDPALDALLRRLPRRIPPASTWRPRGPRSPRAWRRRQGAAWP